MYYIGIDTGTHTGIAVWSSSERKLVSVETKAIHVAMQDVLRWHREHPGEVFVRFEDARLRNWFGSAGREQLQGAGSIKRDCQIWEDFLADAKIPFSGVPPRKTSPKSRLALSPASPGGAAVVPSTRAMRRCWCLGCDFAGSVN